MENLDESVKINHNPNWPHIPDHPYKILINGGFRSEKTYASLNLRNQKLDLNKKNCFLKIHVNQSINYSSTKSKK